MPAVAFDPAFDGHTHTHFCPHGSREPLERYLDRAVELGFARYALTEHIPLPAGFRDPMGPLECAGPLDSLWPYLDYAERVREQYASVLTVYVGLEIDYLGAAQGGWHGELLRVLAPVWDRLDPEATLLSLHFLGDALVDGTVELQRALAPTADALHLWYYRCLESALQASWRYGGRDLRPRRVGHLALPRKFVRAHPLAEPERVWDAATRVLETVAREGLELDVNAAGLLKPDCGELYLPEPLLGRAVALGIPLVYGSDAHAPAGVGQRREAVLAALARYA